MKKVAALQEHNHTRYKTTYSHFAKQPGQQTLTLELQDLTNNFTYSA